jgi:hypothetical protein
MTEPDGSVLQLSSAALLRVVNIESDFERVRRQGQFIASVTAALALEKDSNVQLPQTASIAILQDSFENEGLKISHVTVDRRWKEHEDKEKKFLSRMKGEQVTKRKGQKDIKIEKHFEHVKMIKGALGKEAALILAWSPVQNIYGYKAGPERVLTSFVDYIRRKFHQESNSEPMDADEERSAEKTSPGEYMSGNRQASGAAGNTHSSTTQTCASLGRGLEYSTYPDSTATGSSSKNPLAKKDEQVRKRRRLSKGQAEREPRAPNREHDISEAYSRVPAQSNGKLPSEHAPAPVYSSVPSYIVTTNEVPADVQTNCTEWHGSVDTAPLGASQHTPEDRFMNNLDGNHLRFTINQGEVYAMEQYHGDTSLHPSTLSPDNHSVEGVEERPAVLEMQGNPGSTSALAVTTYPPQQLPSRPEQTLPCPRPNLLVRSIEYFLEWDRAIDIVLDFHGRLRTPRVYTAAEWHYYELPLTARMKFPEWSLVEQWATAKEEGLRKNLVLKAINVKMPPCNCLSHPACLKADFEIQ